MHAFSPAHTSHPNKPYSYTISPNFHYAQGFAISLLGFRINISRSLRYLLRFSLSTMASLTRRWV